jgi:hypothetical protein
MARRHPIAICSSASSSTPASRQTRPFSSLRTSFPPSLLNVAFNGLQVRMNEQQAPARNRNLVRDADIGRTRCVHTRPIR